MSQCPSPAQSAPATASADGASFVGLEGSFARRQWERSGVLPIARRLLSGLRLTDQEVQQLARTDLPLLAKLVECKRGSGGSSQPAIVVSRQGDAITEADAPEAAEVAAKVTSGVICRQQLRSERGYQPGLPPRFLEELRRWEARCRSVEVLRRSLGPARVLLSTFKVAGTRE